MSNIYLTHYPPTPRVHGGRPYSNINISVTPRTPQVSLLSKVIEYTQKIFGDEDEYRCCYRGNYGNKYGFLVLSNKRLMFLHERGLSADFDRVFDVPYARLAGCNCVDRNLISIRDAEGKTHQIQTSASSKLVEQQLREFLSPTPLFSTNVIP